jgi:hypothetical protein
MLLDPDMSGESYVEDCQVCCNPIGVEFMMVDDEIVKFRAVKL